MTFSPTHSLSLSYLGIARGSALMGDTAKAKKAFEDFLKLWAGNS
jgi:hypothetical protein